MSPTAQEMAAFARDAQRYRWLREQIKSGPQLIVAQLLFWSFSSRRDFDKEVDRLMARNWTPACEAPKAPVVDVPTVLDGRETSHQDKSA